MPVVKKNYHLCLNWHAYLLTIGISSGGATGLISSNLGGLPLTSQASNSALPTTAVSDNPGAGIYASAPLMTTEHPGLSHAISLPSPYTPAPSGIG